MILILLSAAVIFFFLIQAMGSGYTRANGALACLLKRSMEDRRLILLVNLPLIPLSLLIV